MPKSFSFAKILSRLAVRGAVLATTGAASRKYEGCVPLLGADNKLDPSVLGTGTVLLGDVTAENVTFTTAPENDTGVANVRVAINNITKDTGGLAMLRARNLSDVADRAVAFNGLKLAATASASSAVLGGVVGVANQAETVAGTETSTDASIGATLLVVGPKTVKDTYLSKLATGNQTIASTLTLGGAPSSGMMATTKTYVDALVAASNNDPVGNTVYVDAVNGVDLTAERGKAAKPALTLGAAKALASSGDVIVVGPGTYNANDLAKNGVLWYFQAGAKVYYTSGGDSSVAVFNVASGETCTVAGYGEFWNMHSSASTRYVIYVRTGGKLNFEGNWVQSSRSVIFVDAGSTGYAAINIRDSVRSDAGDTTGSCAARMVTGVCHLTVGREIFSSGSQFQAGLEFGNGSLSTADGWQVVRCPRITGKYNAIHFNGTKSAVVYTDTCYASDGPAVKVDGGDNNVLIASAQLSCDATSSATVVMTKGRLTLRDTNLIAANSNQVGIYLNGTPYDAAAPYLILNDTQIWSRGNTTVAVSANQSGYFTMRILGSAQSDCVEPTTVVRVGGAWDYVASAAS